MSNTPNMSYCAFENTAAAIRQLIGMLGDAIDAGEPLTFSSRDEESAFDDMYVLMEELQGTIEQYYEHFNEDEC